MKEIENIDGQPKEIPDGIFFCVRNENTRTLYFISEEEYASYISKLPSKPQVETKHPVILAVGSMTPEEKEELVRLLSDQLK